MIDNNYDLNLIYNLSKNDLPQTILAYAVLYGDLNLIEYLIKKGSDINQINYNIFFF